jgi:hypothetical protein
MGWCALISRMRKNASEPLLIDDRGAEIMRAQGDLPFNILPSTRRQRDGG